MIEPRPGKQHLSSLATRIILFVFASTCATALIVGWTSIESTQRSLRRALEQRYPALLESAAEDLHELLAEGREELGELALRGAAEGAMARAGEGSPHFAGFAVLDAAGSVQRAVGAGRSLARGSSPASDSGGDLLLRADSAGRRLLVARTALPDGGSLLGVFDTDALAERLQESAHLEHETLLLVDQRGRQILPAHGGARGGLPAAQLASPGVSEYENGRGLHVIGSVRPLGAFGASIAVESPFAVAFEPLLSLVARVFAIDLCVILLFSYLAYRITAAVVKPIEALSDGARRIAQGDFDLEIPQPRTKDEIALLTRTFNDMTRRIRSYQSDVERKTRALEEQNEKLQQAKETFEQLSITDGLTKLHNHRFFQDHLTREIKRVNRTHEPLAMLLVDLDDFKALNDRLGHAAGDELLKRVARIMQASIRDSDLLARYGGEEFAVVASNTDSVGAYNLGEKIRTAIAEESFILDDSLRPVRATVSIGVARFEGNRKTFFQEADRALYRAKGLGKNCVVEAAADAPEAGRAES